MKIGFKKCNKCKEIKPIYLFYKNRNNGCKFGLQSVCKECKHEYYLSHKEYFKKYRELYRDKNRISVHRWEKENKIQLSAMRKVAYNIKIGKIKKLPCQLCGNKNSEAHHDDYLKPLEVKWLCKKCHGDYHRKSKTPISFKTFLAKDEQTAYITNKPRRTSKVPVTKGVTSASLN